MQVHRVWPGHPSPLGATWDGSGVNFAIYSAHASAVELCLFDSPYADREQARLPLRECTHHVWHGYVPGLMPGQPVRLSRDRAVGARRRAPLQQRQGAVRSLRAGGRPPHALARLVARPHRQRPAGPDSQDSAPWAPLAAVVDGGFAWGDDHPPAHAAPGHACSTSCTSAASRASTPASRSICAGPTSGSPREPVIEHLKSLGVTAVELLPVHAHADERHLGDRGLTNFWGYNTLGFFAPESRYGSGFQPLDAVREFKMMVRALHAAGLEVILDVVYNHTGEGSHLGPTLAFRGLDNAVYYRLQPGHPAQYEDFTGCGNTLNVRHPQVLQLVMDSLRYWVTEMRVDGFRFDLAPALGRETGSFDPSAAFFDAVHQDPVLSRVKLIAEPWDLGEHGFLVGRFPAGWSEWNARYRDGLRRYWRGDRGQLPELATRVAGSSDLYQGAGRQPTASINFVTCHDGFTLRDLVSYTQKRNEANGEHNNDGESNNLSTNGGVEGPTGDAAIEAGRLRLVRNFLATLFVSQGVPMICAGDEMGRTQRGNNNAYCQDNEVSWVNWTLTPAERQLLEFTRSLIVIRHAHQVLRRRRYFDGHGHNGDKDVVWYDPRGREMSPAAWSEDTSVVGMRISATVVDERTGLTDPHEHDVLVALFNAGPLEIGFVLPKAEGDVGGAVRHQRRNQPGGTGAAPVRRWRTLSRCSLAAWCCCGRNRRRPRRPSRRSPGCGTGPAGGPPTSAASAKVERAAGGAPRETPLPAAAGGADAREGLRARFDFGPALEDQAAAPLFGALPAARRRRSRRRRSAARHRACSAARNRSGAGGAGRTLRAVR